MLENQIAKTVVMLVLGMCISETSQALLYDRGGGLLYDDVLDVTWLQDANMFKQQLNQTNNVSQYLQTIIDANNGSIIDSPNYFDFYQVIYELSTSDFNVSDGTMNWFGAHAWANSLKYGGYSDWRLANNDGSSKRGYNIIDPNSELSYMYYVNLGLTGVLDKKNTYQPNWGIFGNGTINGIDDTSKYEKNNIGLVKNLQAYAYWSGTEYGTNELGAEYGYAFDAAYGLHSQATKNYYFYAWAVRDGDVASVPIPPAIWLFSLTVFPFVTQRLRRKTK